MMLTRVGRRAALVTLIEIRASQSIVRPRAADEQRAQDILEHFDDKNYSLTDAVSFAVMERPGLTVAFGLDRHFVQFGWRVLPDS